MTDHLKEPPTKVNLVRFGQLHSTEIIGGLRQVDAHTWQEFSEGSNDTFASFREIKRTARMILIYDVSRKVHLRIDLVSKVIRYTEPGAAERELYAIVRTNEKSTGWLVNRAEFTGNDGARCAFRQAGDKNWFEENPGNSEFARFTETARDDWSVYLFDEGRRAHVQIDLHRKKISYADDTMPRADLYDVTLARTDMNGWLANKVEFRAGGRRPEGTYRMVGARTWVEDSRKDGEGLFEFRETMRDEWSIYLQDAGRKIDLQIDLHTKIIYLSSDSGQRHPQYEVHHADRMPTVGLPNGRQVTLIEVGDSAGNASGYLQQSGQGAWRETDTDFTPGAELEEIGRDRWSVYLWEPSARRYLHVNLHENTVHQDDDGGWRTFRSVLRAYTKMTGWIANSVVFEGGVLRQTGWTSWIEERGGKLVGHYEIARRGRNDLTLTDRHRSVRAQVDLARKTVTFAGALEEERAVHTISEVYEFWRAPHKITSRSELTEDFTPKPGAAPVSLPVYRTSVSFAPHTHHIDVWAEEEVTVEINEQKHTIDPDRPARVTPGLHGKLSISIPADDLHAPKLFLHTNLMRVGERHVILPDVEVHKKVVGLKPGAMHAAREELGLKPELSKADVDHVQRAFVNIAKMSHHSYNKSPHGIHHDRAVNPANMEHPHFVLDLSGGGAKYSALSAAEVRSHIAGAERIDWGIGQSFFGDVGSFFKKATHVVVHTVESVGHDIIDTASHVVHDTVHTFEKVGEDIVHGDILEAGRDLVEGGESLGKDLVHGAKAIGTDVATGAKKIAVMTIKAAGKVLQFVIHHTGVIGKALGWVLEKAGAAVGAAVAWLLDKIGWGDVLHTHDVLIDGINKRLDQAAAYPQQLKRASDAFFAKLAHTIEVDFDKAISSAHAPSVSHKPAPAEGHSKAVENVEWLLGKFLHYSEGLQPPGLSFAGGGGRAEAAPLPGPIGQFQRMMEDAFDAEKGQIKDELKHAMDQIKALIEKGDHAPERLLTAFLDIAKGVAVAGVHVLAKVLDVLLDLISAAFVTMKSMANHAWEIPFLSDFYGGLTHGKKLSMISVVALIAAIPTTIITKAATGRRPFDHAGAALSLTEEDKHAILVRDLGRTYASFHIIMTVTASAANASSALSFASKDGFGMGEFNPSEATSFSLTDCSIGGVNLLFAYGAQMVGCPSVPGETYSMPVEQAKNNVFEAPSYWSHVVWNYQWACFGVDYVALIGTSALNDASVSAGRMIVVNDVLAGFNTVRGLVHFALMMVLDHADRQKAGAIDAYFIGTAWIEMRHAGKDVSKLPALEAAAVNKDRRDLAQIIENNAKRDHGHVPYLSQNGVASDVAQMSDAQIVDWLEALHDYHLWAHTPGRIAQKGFGNAMDALPEIGQVGTIDELMEATEMLSLLGTEFMDVFGHLGEGITMAVRSNQNALH